MAIVTAIPTFLYLLVIYNVLAFSGSNLLGHELFSLTLISGAQFVFDVSDLLMVLGVVALYVEILKSTKTSTTSVIEHGLSMLVFVVFLIEFIVVAQAGTATFLILTLMQALDVIAGFTISISSARRDFNVDHR